MLPPSWFFLKKCYHHPIILLYFFYCVYDFFARVKNFRRGLDKHLKFVNEIKRQIKYINDNE